MKKKTGYYVIALALLCTMSLLPGCQLEGDDLLPIQDEQQPIVEPPIGQQPTGALGHVLPLGGAEADEGPDPGPGFIVAGQVGDRFVVDDFGSSGYEIIAREGGTYWTYIVDSSTQAQFMLGASTSGSSTYSYTGVTIGMQGGLELSGLMVQDSVWRCETWSWDSSLHRITTYNSLSNFQCMGDPPAYVSLESRQKPIAYNEGRRIDPNLPWGLQVGYFFLATSSYNSQPTTLGYEETISMLDFSFWADNVPHYLAFRWWSQGRYRYGYVRLAASSMGVTVYRIAYER